jgi:hypothetical protein
LGVDVQTEKDSQRSASQSAEKNGPNEAPHENRIFWGPAFVSVTAITNDLSPLSAISIVRDLHAKIFIGEKKSL